MHPRAPLFAGALLVALGAACGSGASSPGGRPEPVIGSVPANPTADELDFPMDALRMNPSQFAVFDNSQVFLMGECMRKKGFEFETELVPIPPDDFVNKRWYGVLDIEEARTIGFRPSDAELGPRAGDDDTKTGDQMDAAERARVKARQSAMLGPLERNMENGPLGCAGEARDKIGARSLQRELNRVAELGSRAHDEATRDSRLAKIFARWSDCMSERRLRYRDPLELRDVDWKRDESNLPYPDEIEAAVADVQCKEELNLVGHWLAIERAYQERIIAEHDEELRYILDRRKQYLRRAAEVVGG